MRPVNVDKPPIRVSHAKLERDSANSAFRSVCPVCPCPDDMGPGTLPVARDPKTFAIINIDRCTLCGQQFIYTDATINGAKVVDVAPKN
jgi:hypothetical protein